MVEMAVDQAVEQVTNVESASGTGGVQVTYDVDRTAVAHQVVKLWPISHHEQPAHIVKMRSGDKDTQSLCESWCARAQGHVRHRPPKSTQIA